MSDLIQLTDAEIATVAGGNDPISAAASATASYNSQTNNSTVTQSATATNSYSPVTAYVSGSYDPYATVVAVGALASNTALVSQSNSVRASASNRIRG
jgi:hypothetical protein